ncbi:VWA domain-containing protein [Nostoc sp. ChiSLP03a]|uniref:VWA domain-containing protein n=1 Tax=Nostoc sp. ChiSLP03a TaxID=3075380 RepID=UPI002AD25001|nr:VWA domain-containing protein [Nostoc sp. ChiSLP03a]MDZ8211078.1 VWA domain-containing protein [Nostoc sp. ChiSLP03a]
MLDKRDYTLIIDQSGSMWTKDEDKIKIQNEQKLQSRWELIKESTIAFASKCEQLDPDGITVYTFNNTFKRFENVTADKVIEIFEDEEPFGNTNLAAVLQNALDNYFQRKANGKTQPNGEIILVVTDGEADDRNAVVKTIVEATHKIDGDRKELGISFIQIGNDKKATEFLKILDDDLKESLGAKIDIVDTLTFEEINQKCLKMKDVLLRAITD